MSATLNTVAAAAQDRRRLTCSVAGTRSTPALRRPRHRSPACAKVLHADAPYLRARPRKTSPPRWSRWRGGRLHARAGCRRPGSARTSCRASQRCSTWRRSPTSSPSNRRHVRAADLCRQRVRDRAVEGRQEGRSPCARRGSMPRRRAGAARRSKRLRPLRIGPVAGDRAGVDQVRSTGADQRARS